MAKFIFKLQSLLNVKKQIEDSLKNELGKATQKLEYEKGVLKEFELEIDDCISAFNKKSGSGSTAEKLKEYTSYISFLKEKIERQKENVNYTQINVDKYREQLVKAVQERKMLEKLKEKRYEEFLETQLKNERQITDEVVSFNYNNQKT